MAITTELVKATPKWVLYVGLILFIIGIYLAFRKTNIPTIGGTVGGFIITFVGFIMIIFWLSNYEDKMCATDETTNKYICTPIKK